MHCNSPYRNDVLKEGSELGLDCCSLEELFLEVDAGRIDVFHKGEITPLGRLYFSDRCGKPVDQW